MTDRAIHVQLRRAARAVGGLRPARAASLGVVADTADITIWQARAEIIEVVRVGAAGAAAALALTSTGSMVVAAAALVVALGHRLGGIAVLLAVAAVAVRLGTVSFDDVAGVQSVLGAAGKFGPATGAASAWAGAGAVLLATRPIGTDVLPQLVGRVLPAVATAAFAATIATGPGPGGDMWIRVAGTAAGFVIAFGLVSVDELSDQNPGGRFATLRVSAAVAAGIAALVLAGWPSGG